MFSIINFKMARKLVTLKKVTNSTKAQIIKNNNGLVFHVFINGKYHQFCIHKRTSSTLNLVCCDRSCPARLVIETSFTVQLGYRNGRWIYDIDPSIDRQLLLDVENWGACFHVCGRFCNSRSCKMNHKDTCKQSDTRPTWISRDLVTEIKNKRKHDQASKPSKLAAEVAAEGDRQHMPDFQPADGRFQLGIDERKLRKAVYNINQRDTIPMTENGVPEQLIQYCTTTDQDGQPVFEQFIHERPNFIAFILGSDLRQLNNQAWYADGTFEPILNLKYGNANSQQFYQLVVKYELDDRVFCCILGQFLMKTRQTTVYIEIFNFLAALYTQTFPNDTVPFTPPHIHCDYESGFASAVRQTFPTTNLIFCAFHFSQTQHRRLSMIQSKPTKNEILAEVWTCVKAIPYLPWSVRLREQLFVQLRYFGTHLESEEKREKYLNYVDYLWVNYFESTQFSFMNGTIFTYFLNSSDDITNNSVESKN